MSNIFFKQRRNESTKWLFLISIVSLFLEGFYLGELFSFSQCSSMLYGVINIIDYVSKAVCSSCALNAT